MVRHSRHAASQRGEIGVPCGLSLEIPRRIEQRARPPRVSERTTQTRNGRVATDGESRRGVMHGLSVLVIVISICGIAVNTSAGHSTKRVVLLLDGDWQVAEGSMQEIPSEFPHTVPVPGLIDMATPPFADVGVQEGQKRRRAFWYRREFTIDGPIPAVAKLKIHKAKYGTQVFLNGAFVGEHLSCFTPVLFDIRDHLLPNGRKNALVIRVGSFRESLPPGVPDGWDFEKVKYIPGIYDSVELICSGTPHIPQVQTVPDIGRKLVRVVAWFENAGPATEVKVDFNVCEAGSTKRVERVVKSIAFGAHEAKQVEVTIPVTDCRLWSPKKPFLYQLTVDTGQDVKTVRFGMRSFRFDPETKMPLLNNKPYPLRGTNVCIYRFFEDPARGDLPWRSDWVRALHRLFKSMNWNAARYCIGFPPENWYDIADEEGILIQDEFPIWYGHEWPEQLTSEQIAKEYAAWMQERWNHPCVVIWDAQNESITPETGKAIESVRELDLSDRPWDNGWNLPLRPTDIYEAHPYPFYSEKGPKGKPSKFRFKDFADFRPTPGTPGKAKGNKILNTRDNPVVINEYGWLWLNRDGTPTILSRRNYHAILGAESTEEERREFYARHLAAMTEFWRCHRKVAGILHFCGLGYSRPGGETSDHFLDVENLRLDPYFKEFVGEAFTPVGLMIDYWAGELPLGEKVMIPVIVINDLSVPWQGTVTLSLLRDGQYVVSAQKKCAVAPTGRMDLSFEIATPEDDGPCELVAALYGEGGKRTRSRREVSIVPLQSDSESVRQ